jgi:hypothetical protein
MGSYSLMTSPLSINLTRSLKGMCIKSKRLVEFILKKGGMIYFILTDFPPIGP